MKKWMTMLFAAILSIGLLVGCSNEGNTNNIVNENNNNSAEEVEEITIQVTLSEDEGAEQIAEKDIVTENGAILLDVMKANFDIEEDDGFITVIDGKQAEDGEEKGWIYYVNGEMAMVGAAEFELSDGDEVNFDFQPWE